MKLELAPTASASANFGPNATLGAISRNRASTNPDRAVPVVDLSPAASHKFLSYSYRFANIDARAALTPSAIAIWSAQATRPVTQSLP